MSCCSCPIQPCPSRHATWLPRIGFGVMMIGFGLNHYFAMGGDAGFVAMTKGPLMSMPALAGLVGLLAYVLPALEIIGGAAFALGSLKGMSCLAKVCLLATFGGIMGWAGLGMAMASDQQTAMMMGQAFQGALMALVGYWVIKKMSCCGGNCVPEVVPAHKHHGR